MLDPDVLASLRTGEKWIVPSLLNQDIGIWWTKKGRSIWDPHSPYLKSGLCHHHHHHSCPLGPWVLHHLDVLGQVTCLPLNLSNRALQRSNESMCVKALCKWQTARQRVVIMLVNYTHKDMLNRNKPLPQTTAESFLAAAFWWLSEVKTTQGLVTPWRSPCINIHLNCSDDPIYGCTDH